MRLRSSLTLAACLAAFTVALAAPPKPPAFDLSGLPEYAPAREGNTGHCHNANCLGEWGVIRIHANELQQPLLERWMDAFLKMHPNIRYSLYTVPNGASGFTVGTHEIGGMGHTAWRSDMKAFQQSHGYSPTQIMFATGGFDDGKGNTPAPIFIVHKDNPLSQLTLAQIDGIFGAQRSGGWTEDYRWNTAVARGPEKNIRTWGQLGLTGEWADKPIRVFGFDATLSNWSELIQRVAFQGGDKWNPKLTELVRGGHEAPADQQIVDGVANDRYAIGFNFMRIIRNQPGVKTLAVGQRDGGPFVEATAQTNFERTYPFANGAYLFVDKPPGKPLPPRIYEFMRFVLSRQGQQMLADQGMFVPLNAKAAREQLAKLGAPQ